jgi:hypothetical protein
LKLKCDELLSTFAFKFNLRRYQEVRAAVAPIPTLVLCWDCGRGLHSSNFWLNLSAFCGIGGECRGCLRGVQGVSGDIRGCLGFIMRQKRLRVS